ncbi:hypothetical protein PV04_07175 [Phialophora macrospora]|uniref:Uncharacterized protein n=1 Tax=Phialophora macrospora TaxID=1851006 RepID=A0A0D2CI26_9EURO|nr:hypothetical protein PV04_07175 [Phialophora macrospora]
MCVNLKVNRSLLIGILAEIRTLFQQHVEKYGRYERMFGDGDKRTTSLDGNVLDHMETLPEGTRGSNRAIGLGRRVVQTGKNLRMIAVEPKRLVWAVVDKTKFEQLLDRLEELNSFLIALLDGAQVSRLQEAVNSSYLEILQIRNDLGSLKALLQALSIRHRYDGSVEASALSFGGGGLSVIVQEQQQKEEADKGYLQSLAEIKMQYTRLANLDAGPSRDSSVDRVIDRKVDFRSITLESDNIGGDWDRGIDRTNGRYEDRDVWIEWKESRGVVHNTAAQPSWVEDRMRLLADLLSSEKPERFRAHRCLGYVKIVTKDDPRLVGYADRFGMVFDKPSSAFPGPSKMVTLRALLEDPFKPSFSARTTLSAVLARCVLGFHDVNWLHKGLRSDNILFYIPADSHPNEWQRYQRAVLAEPYVSGFELSRPDSAVGMSEGPEANAARDLYRHPRAQSANWFPRLDSDSAVYRKSYDLYSLGLVLLEIALWRPLENLLGVQNVHQLSVVQLRNVKWMILEAFETGAAKSGRGSLKVHGQDTHLAVPATSGSSGTSQVEIPEAWQSIRRVSEECGDVFLRVIEKCIRADEIDTIAQDDRSLSTTGVLIRRMMEKEVVERLENLSTAMRI